MKPVSDADLARSREWTGELIATQQAAVAAGHDFDAVMQVVLEGVLRLLPQAFGANIIMNDPDGLRIRAVAGGGMQSIGYCFVAGRSLARLALERREALYTIDSLTDDRVDRQLARANGVRSILMVPLPYGEEIAGVLGVSAEMPGAFDERDLRATQLIAAPLIIGLSNLRAADALRARRDSDRRLMATFDHAPVGIAHVAPDGRFLCVNRRFSEIVQRSEEDLLAHGFQNITHPDDLASDLANVQRLIDGEADRYAMEKRYVCGDGSLVWVNLTVALVRDAGGQPDFFVSVIEDLSEIKRALEDAARDPLTGMLNRRGTIETLARDFALVKRRHAALGLLFLDLDGFKLINDEHGHAAGDACLKEIADAVTQAIRPGDTAGRVGGDEFVIWTTDAGQATLLRIAERLRLAVAMTGNARGWPISASIGGFCGALPEWSTPEAMIARVDAAMFQAKKAGKNRIHFLPE